MEEIPLTLPDCIGNINLKVGSQRVQGNQADLSAFGTNIYDWQLVEFVRKDTQHQFRLNGKLIYSSYESGGIGEIVGVNINFSRTGSIDFVGFENMESMETNYREDF